MKKSGYPESLQESLANVEKTRPERLKEAKKQKYFPKLSPDEYREVLEKYHPDYKPEERKPLQVGPNKGDMLQPELLAVLQGRPWLEPGVLRGD